MRRQDTTPENTSGQTLDATADAVREHEATFGPLPSEAHRRQLAREIAAKTDAGHAAEARASKAKARGNVASLPPHQRLIVKWTHEGVAPAIRRARNRKGANGPAPRWVRLTKDIPAATLARVILETIVTYLCIPTRGRRRGSGAAGLAIEIAWAVDESRLTLLWQARRPSDLRALRRRLRRGLTTRAHQKKVLSHVLNNHALLALRAENIGGATRWDRAAREDVGLGLLRLALVALGGRLQRYSLPRPRGLSPKRRPPTGIRFDDETQEFLSKGLALDISRAFVHRPMLVPPEPWSGPESFIYLRRPARAFSVITGGPSGSYSRRLLEADHENAQAEGRPPAAAPVYAALNYLANTPLRINRCVLRIARLAQDAASRGAGFLLPGILDKALVEMRHPFPPRPAEGESAKAYRVAKRKVHEARFAESQKLVGLDAALNLAADLADEPALYFPHRCDFRSRAYAFCTLLTAQGSDLKRALIEFAEGKPITPGTRSEFWLAIHVANCFGRDKLPLNERAAWTFQNEPLVRGIAEDPFSNRSAWLKEAGDDPWMALAATLEWTAYRDACDLGAVHVSHLPIYIDATTSGIQHLAALARDPELARLTNLLPAAAPSDLYAAVADTVLAMVRKDAALSPWADTEGVLQSARLWLKFFESTPPGTPRKLTKPAVMTRPYGSTVFTIVNDIREQLAALDPRGHVIPLDFAPKAAGYMARRISQALGSRLRKAEAVTSWLKIAAAAVASHASDSESDFASGIAWVAPSGWPLGLFEPHQESRLKTSRDLHVSFVRPSTTQVNPRAQRQVTPVNFCHALDASTLTLTLNELECASSVRGVIAIHDALGALAADVGAVSAAFRQGFRDTHAAEPLRTFEAAVRARLPANHLLSPPPEPGDFDLAQVLDAEHFAS